MIFHKWITRKGLAMMGVFSAVEQATCSAHGEYECKIVEILGKRLRTPCPVCQKDAAAREEARQKRQDAEANDRLIKAMFQRSGIPPRFQSRTFDTYQAAERGQMKALTVSRAYAESWPSQLENGTGLIFSGGPGTGKTHLSCAIAHAVIQKGSSALFTTVGDAMRSIKRSYDRDANMSEADAIRALEEPSLQILDEIGADYGTDHSKALLFDIFNKRYENVRPTIVLTNLDAPALREYLGDRIIDRMREGGGKMIVFDWQSHRA